MSKGKAKYTLSFSGVPALWMRFVISSLLTPRNHGEPPGRALAKQSQVGRLDAAGEVVEVRGAGVTVVHVLVEAERGIRVDQVQARGLIEEFGDPACCKVEAHQVVLILYARLIT